MVICLFVLAGAVAAVALGLTVRVWHRPVANVTAYAVTVSLLAVFAVQFALAGAVMSFVNPPRTELEKMTSQIAKAEQDYYNRHGRYQDMLEKLRLSHDATWELDHRVKLLERVSPDKRYLRIDFTARNGATRTLLLFPAHGRPAPRAVQRASM